MLWGVVGLPVLLPIVALLQLLFPGLLRDQWRQYRYAVQVLLTQSTLICLHWALVKWVFKLRPWWLSDDALAAALVAVALWGVVRAWFNRSAAMHDMQDSPATSAWGKSPAGVEYWALGVTFLVGAAWAAYAIWSGGSPWDQMAVISLAALVGLLHLGYRQIRAARGGSTPRWSTELVFVVGLAVAGMSIGLYARQTDDNRLAGEVRESWPTFHGNSARTGTALASDRGPDDPHILWTFDPRERKGRITLHSSPCVVGGQVYIGAMHQVLGLAQGFLYCVNAEDGRQAGDHPLALGGRIWTFSADNSLLPVFSSPTAVDGRLYIGEGYHQNSGCRLFCLDAQNADRVLWSKATASHVESTPTVDGSRIYFGAGDDGVRCLDSAQMQTGPDGEVPKTLWHVTGMHVDSSPTLQGGRLFAGSVVGDVYQEICALAIDADTGKVAWKVPAPVPLAGAPAAAEGRVYFPMASGKLNEDSDAPDGRLWCLSAADGNRQWEFRAAGGILGSPVLSESLVFCASRDHYCYALESATGRVAWKQDLGEPVVTTPIVSGGRVFVLTIGGSLVAMNANSGDVLWRFDDIRTDDGDVFSSPVLVAGRLYAASGGKLYCIGDSHP